MLPNVGAVSGPSWLDFTFHMWGDRVGIPTAPGGPWVQWCSDTLGDALRNRRIHILQPFASMAAPSQAMQALKVRGYTMRRAHDGVGVAHEWVGAGGVETFGLGQVLSRMVD